MELNKHTCQGGSLHIFKQLDHKGCIWFLVSPPTWSPGCSFHSFGCLNRAWGLALGVQNPPPSLDPRKRKWIPFLGGQARAGRERDRGSQKNWLSGCRREKTARAREARVTATPFAPFLHVISSPPPPLSLWSRSTVFETRFNRF
jgi:hypothetical protein